MFSLQYRGDNTLLFKTFSRCHNSVIKLKIASALCLGFAFISIGSMGFATALLISLTLFIINSIPHKHALSLNTYRPLPFTTSTTPHSRNLSIIAHGVARELSSICCISGAPNTCFSSIFSYIFNIFSVSANYKFSL